VGAVAEIVARVLGTEDATPMTFWAAVAEGQHLQLDDVVAVARTLPDGRRIAISGMVTQVRARHEGATYDSDVFLVSDGVLPAQVVECAEVSTTRVEPEIYVPPLPGSAVYRVTGADRDSALYFDQMAARLPAGLGRDGEPLYVNLEFLDGTRGAHANISGISGIATKTTYATFLLYSLFTSGVLGAEAVNTKALIFNVKGEDLLFLDHPNAALDAEQAGRYRTLGLAPEPFRSVAFFAPPRRGDPNAGPDVSTRATGVDSFYWTLADFAGQELLPYVFADAEDERQQYTMVIHNVTAKLHREGLPAGDDGAWRIDGETLTTYSGLVDLLVARLTDDATASAWAGPAIGMGTINAFVRRLTSSVRSLGPLVRADVPRRPRHAISLSDAQVTVVDLHNLPDRAKRFVVGVTLRQEFERKELSGRPRPLLYVVLDELNKYAPREGNSPIKEILLDVAERGRSLGVILIGAQQTASEVERRVIANSAIRIVGRLDPAEAARPEYGFLPASQRDRAILAKPGTMFVAQPQLPVPLVAEFPFPAWATRPAEIGGPPVGAAAGGTRFVPDDPFADLPGARVPTPDVPPF
jgi:DNA helicase HerA-like ATPase